jgi:hypothetical protein
VSAVVILSVGVAVVLVLPLAWRVRQHRFDPFEPIVIFALAWGVMFVVRPIAIVIRDDTNFYGVDISPTLDKSVLLGLIGAVGFVVGHASRSSHGVAQRLPLLPAGLGPGVLLYATLASMIGVFLLVVFLLSAGGTSAIGTFLGGRSIEFDDVLRGSPLYLWSLSFVVVPSALLGLAVAVRDRRRSTVVVAAVLVALALVRAVPTGNRVYVLVLVGGAVTLLYLHRAKRPGLVAVAVGLTAALLGSYVLLVFRDAETRDSVTSSLERIAETPSRLFSPLTKRPDSEMAPALAGALLVIPSDLPHRYGGATLGDLAARPIPRHLWSGKPQPHVLVVTERVWPVARETGGFQPNFTPLLSFYWDFGLLGAFLGMTAYGWLARLAYRYLLRDFANMTAQVLYALVLWSVVFAVRVDPVLFAFHIGLMVVPVVVIARLGSTSRDPARDASRAV